MGYILYISFVERIKMIKKSLIIALGMSALFAQNLYAENPFDDNEIKIENSTSGEELEVANVEATEDTNTKEATNSKFPVSGTLVDNGVRLREWAWGPIINTYNSTTLTVLGISGDFYEVEIGGTRGFMHKNFISTPDCPATREQPYYPGNTLAGGYLSREESLQYTDNSTNPDNNKETTTTGSTITDSSNTKTEETVVSTNTGISANDFNKELQSMSTPTREEIIQLAASIGLSKDYVVILIGTTQREGYIKDQYLYYGWASCLLNSKVTIGQMQGWDPYHTGDANYYSQKNINDGYNSASSDVLKSVYLALKYRNKKIAECNGMYGNTPSSYNLIYKSSVYNCSIYESK